MMATTNEQGTDAERWTVLGTFAQENAAMGALNALREADFRAEQVSVISRDTATAEQIAADTDMVADEAGRGAMVGTLLGGLAGWLIGLSAFAIPGVGPIIGAGIIGTTLAGAGLGAAAGGFVGALGTYGIPEAEAQDYEEALRQGHVLLSVHTAHAPDAARARAIFTVNGGQSVRSFASEEVGDDDTAGLNRSADGNSIPRYRGAQSAQADFVAAGHAAGGMVPFTGVSTPRLTHSHHAPPISASV